MASNIPVIVQGNSFSLAIPLQIYYINGDQMDLQDYTPDPTDEVSVQLKGSRRNYTYTPTIDGNVANIDLSGNELADNYSVVVSIVKANGQRLRSFRTDQFFIVESSDDLTTDDIIQGLEENVIYLNSSIFVAGADGRGIEGIQKTGTSGLVDTYTIYYTDNTTTTFQVTNGDQGAQGVGITSIEKTGTSGLVDTYTITLSNGQTSTFEVTNGRDGVDLGLANIVNNLITGGATDVLSAEMGKELGSREDKVFFYGDAKIVPVSVTHQNKKYCNRQDGTISTSSNTAFNFAEVELNGANYVAFNGVSIENGGSTTTGFAFGYYATPGTPSSWVTVETDNWDVEGAEKNAKKYMRKVPNGATHLRTTSSCYGVLTADNFYCNLIFGKILEDTLWGGYGYAKWEDLDAADITITEKKVINASNGNLTSNTNYDVWSVDVEGLRFIRFSEIQTVSTPSFGYSFYTNGNAAIMPTQYIGNGVAQKTVDVIISVPANAKYFKFSAKRDSPIGRMYVQKQIAEISSLNDKINAIQQSLEEFGDTSQELEMPLTGLTLTDNKVATDAIYTPEQFNFGGFRVILPDDISVTWYRGDNPDNFGSGDSIVVHNGDIVKFPTKYTYYNIFRLYFQSSGTISVNLIKEHIAAGRIKILYTPNDGHLSITQRQSHCEQYVRALQARLVTNFADASRKCYGTHDLPMIVHCTDVHNDIVRLSSAMEYAKYIQADAVVLTGDYVMRGATNGYGYLKDLDEKWNPDGEDATQKLPILVGTGNHDPWHSTLEDMRAQLIDPFIEKHNYRKDANDRIENVAYYYVDLNIPAPRDGGYISGSSTYNHTQMVRIIMLDLVDEQAGEISRWGISQEQIEWFIDTLNSTPEGAAILIGMHTSPDFMEAPSVRAAKYQQESPQVRELKYATDMFTYKGFLANDSEFLNGSYNFSGSPIMAIIDAFISRTTASGSYTYKVGGTNYSIPQASVVTKTVNWAADFSNAGGVFVAYLCGHTHADLVSYIKDAQNTQLCLCTTCTVCEYGPYNNGRGSSNADCVRGSSGATQDGFNVYVLDMANKRVGIARIGANMTVGLEPRTACWLSFADTSV